MAIPFLYEGQMRVMNAKKHTILVGNNLANVGIH